MSNCFIPSPNSHVKHVIARLVNCIIKALNDAKKLPKVMVIIPDWDILKFLDIDPDDEGAFVIIRKALDWILTQIQRVIEAKKDNFQRRKPGSVLSNKPKNDLGKNV